MQLVKLQLNTPQTVNQDLDIQLISEATGKVVKATPYLDGTVAIRDLSAGAWRLKIAHPNLLNLLVDQRIKVFPDRPTFIPIRIPASIFSNTAIQDIPDADLGPVQSKLDALADVADGLADKRPGDPIFSGDWNDLSTAMAGVSRATGDLARLVSPVGHDHPELVEKMDEIQSNMQIFYDLFGKTLAGIQRQIQELALKQAVEDVIAADDPSAPTLTDADKTQLRDIVSELAKARRDRPRIYAYSSRRVGEKYSAKVAEMSARSDALATSQAVALLAETAQVMANLPVTDSYTKELASHEKVESTSGGGFTQAVKAAKLGL